MISDDDFKFIKYMNVGSRRFSFWITFMDKRPYQRKNGRRGKKDLISFWSARLGALGDQWEYSLYPYTIVIKLNNEQDVTMTLLKYHK